MATPLIQTSFATGEISPSLFGRVDIEKERISGSTVRNCFVGYKGGAISRAGTEFVGFSKQTGRSFPPRVVTFQFSIGQGLMLEFGHLYMRVVDSGAFVTERPVAIGGASQADPAVLTFGAQGATAATANNAAVTFSYAPGDLISIAGGVSLAEAVVAVTSSELVSILVNNHGSGYAVNDTITLAGGTFSVAGVAKVTSVVAVAASGFITFANNPTDGDTVTLNGVAWTFKTLATAAAQTTIQTTLAGTLAQLATDLNASANASLTPATYGSTTSTLTITYDTTGAGGNAYTLAASVAVVSAGTLTGGTTTGVGLLSINTKGIYTALPALSAMTQSATSGGGTGATFQTAVFGPHALTISSPGAYTTTPTNPAAQDTTTGIGRGATFTMTYAATPAFANDDWVQVSGVGGMTQLNGNTYRVSGVTSTTIQLFDVYGNPVDSTSFGAYTSGGLISRIYTVTTPYDEQDLDWLKFSQSADEMTVCCVNQLTGTEYAPQILSRLSDTNWVFSAVVPAPSVLPPASISASISSTGTTFYQYVVTAVSPVDGTESIASGIVSIQGVDISSTKGQVNLTWPPVAEVNVYNIYKAPVSYGSAVPVGSLFGLIGKSYGAGFQDANVTPNFDQVPPRHQNPFARGQIVGVNIVTGGSGYTTASGTITTSTGSGAVIEFVVQSGKVVAAVIDDDGHDYASTDTIAITGSGGSGATATLSVGPNSGTYPSVSAYFQQRRVFADSLNNPDTYWMSQPGAFGNFDTRIPTIDTDAITGSPWSTQVNGIQFLVQASSGLVVFTGLAAWLLVGAGSFATNVQPISPDSQQANPQPFTGCSPTVAPVKINYDILYVTSIGSFYYMLPYQGYSFTEPVDITQYATHLFTGFDVVQNAWCEQPYKVLWSVRDDGTMQSLTYLKAEQINGWARHDTDGQFVSTCSVIEPPVDALYLAVKRFPGTNTAYMIERMNDRIWSTVEDAWCVDSALSLSQATPNATLTASSANGAGQISGVTNLVGGSGYSDATIGTIIDEATDSDDVPFGSGATVGLTIIAGVITAINVTAPGTNYQRPKLVITDPAGSAAGNDSASATLQLDTSAVFTASSGIFSVGDIGSVIRMGGGVATISAFINGQTVTAQINTPITALRPNSGGQVLPQGPGDWTLGVQVSAVSGLGHLAGATVTGLADGNEVTPRVVSSTGVVTLDAPASSVVLGLGFKAQLQSVYLDGGSPTVQGQRKKIAGVSVMVENSRGVEIGANQVDGSTLSPMQIDVDWNGMQLQPDQVPAPYNSDTAPLYTGFLRDTVQGGWVKNGQIALQQTKPLPMSILSIEPEFLEGDTAEQQAQPRQKKAA